MLERLLCSQIRQTDYPYVLVTRHMTRPLTRFISVPPHQAEVEQSGREPMKTD